MDKLIAWGQVLPAMAVLMGAYFDGHWSTAATTAAWVAGIQIALVAFRFFYPEWRLLPRARTQAAGLVRVGASQLANRLDPPQ